MQAVIFIGLQATGKSSFYLARFYRTHVRINGDMLRTRRREELLLNACLEGKTAFVLDKVNLTRESRATVIAQSRLAGFRVVGYYFRSSREEALARNAVRPEAERVPELAIKGTARQLERPAPEEGFDELHYVSIGPEGFVVKAWQDDEL
jgi:predicted kinase